MANHHFDGTAGKAPNEVLDALREAGVPVLTPDPGALREQFMEQMLTMKLGAQDDAPDGLYGHDDQGAVAFLVAADPKNRKVLFDFGTPVKWMAASPEQARHLGRMLLQKADEAEAAQQAVPATR